MLVLSLCEYMCTYFKILKAYESRLKMLWETPRGLPIPYNMWARAILTKVRDRGHMTSPPPLLRVTMWTVTIFVKLKRDFIAIFTSPTKETLGLQYTLG